MVSVINFDTLEYALDLVYILLSSFVKLFYALKQ